MTSVEFPPWKLAQRLGTGTLTEAFAAEGPQGVAVVKRLLPFYAENELLSAAFILRGEEMKSLDHPAILRVFATGSVGRDRYLVVERAEGRALSRVFSRLEQKGWSALPQLPVVACAYQAAKALAHAHSKGVLHLDVTLHNLYLSPTGHLRVTDFGLAHARRSYAPDAGAVELIPPELRANGKPDPRVDVWQLAASTYMLLAGGLPPNALSRGFPPLGERIEGADENLSDLLMRALSPIPAERPLAMAELVAGLGTWLDRAGVTDAAAAAKSLYANVFSDEPSDDGWSVPQVREWPDAEGTGHKVFAATESTPTSPKAALGGDPKRRKRRTRWMMGAAATVVVGGLIWLSQLTLGFEVQQQPADPPAPVVVVTPAKVDEAAVTEPEPERPRLRTKSENIPEYFIVSSERHGFFLENSEGVQLTARTDAELVVTGTSRVPVLTTQLSAERPDWQQFPPLTWDEHGAFVVVVPKSGLRQLHFVDDVFKIPEGTQFLQAGYFTDRVSAKLAGDATVGTHLGSQTLFELPLANKSLMLLEEDERFTLSSLYERNLYEVTVEGEGWHDGLLVVAHVQPESERPVIVGPARGRAGQWLLKPGTYAVTGVTALLFSLPRGSGSAEVRFDVSVESLGLSSPAQLTAWEKAHPHQRVEQGYVTDFGQPKQLFPPSKRRGPAKFGSAKGD